MKKIAAIGFALLMVFAVFVPFASATAPRDYQMKVNPNPVGDGGQKPTFGNLYVDLACRSPQIGGEFTISSVVVSKPFTNAARVDKGFVDQYVKVMGASVTHQYRPDGQFDTSIMPGTYLLKQIDGNGGQAEYALVTIKAGEKQTVVFLGHGISGITPKVADPVITVTEATYGAQRVVVDQQSYTETVTDVAAVPAHPQHPEGDTVVDVPAHDVVVPATYKTVPCTHIVPEVPAVTHQVKVIDVPYQAAVPAVTHQEKVIDVPYQPAVPAVTHTVTTFNGDYNKTAGHMVYVGAGKGLFAPTFDAAVKDHNVYQGQYDKSGAVYTYVGTTGGRYQLHAENAVAPTVTTVVDSPAVPEVPEQSHMITVIDTPAIPEVAEVSHMVTVIDTPAVPATVQHPAGDSVVDVAEHTITVPATYKTVACTHIVPAVPAVTHDVFHPAVTHIEGAFVDVKTEVQAVLDAGVQNMRFMNGPNPGGIFDTDNNLLQTIADPAYGQLKTVHIVYNVDGGAPKTVDKMENEIINLV